LLIFFPGGEVTLVATLVETGMLVETQRRLDAPFDWTK
jgi:hypothetical protein